MMERLAHGVLAHKKRVLIVWLVLTIFGAFSAQQVSKRWLEQFSIPGYSAYETNQKTLRIFGTGEQPPHIAVLSVGSGDVTKTKGVKQAFASVARQFPKFRTSSYFTTGNDAYVSRDRHLTFATFYAPGNPSFTSDSKFKEVRKALEQAAPPGVAANLTGRDALYASEGGSSGPSVLTEAMIGGAGALVILLFVFGTLPAVGIPIMVAVSSILNTFTLVWLLTYITPVSIIVQFLVALVGLGVAIDYALLMIFRFREELAHGEDVETAVVETMKHAGRSVIVSGSTVAIGLFSMVIIPVPVIRSIGLGGMLIPAVSVLAAITLMPAMFGVLGHRINRYRVMPKRIVEHPELESSFWGRWARVVLRRPAVVAAIGIAIVALLLVPGVQLNPSEAQAKDLRGGKAEDAVVGFNRLTAAGISPGVLKPFDILVEGSGVGAAAAGLVARQVAATPGVQGASAPAAWRRPGAAIVEAFPAEDGAARSVRKTISNLQHQVLPRLQEILGNRDGGPGPAPTVNVKLGGVAPEERDFVHAVYGKFPYVLAFVILLTFVLLMRAFRSVILPLKAVVLNLVSLGAAFGIIVFIFQMGHGAEAIWNVHPTGAIISWIPLMIFAFLYGLSMDYEVFMLTRMREAYDETGDTSKAVALGLARTGKLVTSAALVLMFAFFVLSSSPGTDIKQFGIGLAAGIIFDATVIRALLVPAIVKLIGRWNWWLPAPAAKVLFTQPSRPRPEPAAETA